MARYDCTIIGSGIVGLDIALPAKEYRNVLIITEVVSDDFNTRYGTVGITLTRETVHSVLR